MSLSRDESRALGFIALLLALSAGARMLDKPKPFRLDATSVDLNALEAASRAAREGGAQVRPLRTGERIDPNTATVAELMRLPRSTRALAERIVAERETRPFHSLADLDRVRGIGPATLEDWTDRIALPVQSAAVAEVASVSQVSPEKAPATKALKEPVDVNRATVSELERVPGIGPALAARIVARRDSVGGFKSLDELERIRGIGPATLKKLKPFLKL